MLYYSHLVLFISQHFGTQKGQLLYFSEQIAQKLSAEAEETGGAATKYCVSDAAPPVLSLHNLSYQKELTSVSSLLSTACGTATVSCLPICERRA